MMAGRARSRGTKEWAGAVFGETSLSEVQAVLLIFAHSVQETVLRCRGNLTIIATQDAAADDEVVAFGIIAVSDAAAAAGGVSIPGPILNPEASWLWHQYVPLAAGSSASPLDDAIGTNRLVEIDTKSMRRLGANESLILVGERDSTAFASVQVNGGLRVLSLFG